MAENQFNPALPLPIKWSIGDDRFNEGQQVLSLTIPVDSVTHLIDHLQNLVDQKQKMEKYTISTKKRKLKLNVYKSTLKRWMGSTEYLATLIHRRLNER
ncbi:MAG: hypothetical protein CM15mL8_290 [Caudoviricetes sp.]|nr:MAG: hypothetical protein CM15mL8_290 [Caudoviricetes sp.]